MSALVSQRLNEGDVGPTYYPQAEIVAALNEANRLFCLLTLCLEKTATWNVANATTFFHMLGVFSDWIAPLRVTDMTGAKVRPGRLQDLSALDSQWIASPGDPYRYSAIGADLLALYQQPAGYSAGTVTAANGSNGVGGIGTAWTAALAGGWIQIQGVYYAIAAVYGANIITLASTLTTTGGSGLAYSTGVNLGVTYARSPAALVNDTDVPEPPAEYHPRLVDYAVYRCRQVESGQEFEKALPLLDRFLDGADHHAGYVRARNLGSRYDTVPFELALFDRSTLTKKRPSNKKG